MADDLLFPQHGDEPDAAYFAALAGTVPEPGFIISGFTFENIDYLNFETDISRGRACVALESMNTSSSDIDPAKTVDDVIQTVQFSGATNVSVPNNGQNELYLDARPSIDDSPQIVVNPGTVADGMLKLGEIDNLSSTSSEQWHLVAADGTLTFPTEDAANSAAANIREGSVVYARDNNIHYYVD